MNNRADNARDKNSHKDSITCKPCKGKIRGQKSLSRVAHNMAHESYVKGIKKVHGQSILGKTMNGFQKLLYLLNPFLHEFPEEALYITVPAIHVKHGWEDFPGRFKHSYVAIVLHAL